MKFNVHTSPTDIIATVEAKHIDDAEIKAMSFIPGEDLDPDVDCVSDHITLITIEDHPGAEGAKLITYAVCEEGYTPDAEDFVVNDLPD